MKKLFLILTVAVLATCSSCNVFKKAQAWTDTHCPKSYITDPTTGKVNIYYECDSLYPTAKLKDKCSKIEICFNAAEAKVTGTAVCDSLFDVKALLKQVFK